MLEKPNYNSIVTFSYKSCWEHLRDFAKSPFQIIGAAVAVFGALWTFSEATIQFIDANPRGWQSYSLLIIISAVSSIVWNGYRYYHFIPEGFENVSRKAAHIAHWQRFKWEFHLAQVLLNEKLAPYDDELRDMYTGRSFIIADKPENLKSYIHWITTRPDNLLKMMAVAEQILITDFPEALFSTQSKPAQPLEILEAVEKLARFYESTLEFERSSRSVMPSESLQKLHELQFGWSEPIRNGVHQLFRLLQQIIECDPKSENMLDFTIKFPEPPKLQKYREELSRLTPLLPHLAENW